MAVIEEIQQMKASGIPDQEIVQNLQSRGLSAQQAYEAISQATIKDAVVQEATPQEYQQADMQPSMMNAPQEQTYMPEQAAQYPQEGYYQETSQSPQLSTDTISEIADQIITEKTSVLRDSIEKMIDFKTSTETKVQALDERLQRIEKIIDRLQLSIMQKVGEQMTNIEDIKKELIETQKTFKSMVPHHKQ